ncbi:hypothetical protein GE061_015327 [Apolygus lucorum]|uniref:Uncharacterized protein n=1 Tax=Apolygus lucorum TaxID=248454 RepID=A0A8S9XLS2_APOLU|nr:hypothetical protein GE061_015327 [Apolygus lucorum]
MFMGCAIYIYGIFIMKAILLEEPGIPTTWTYEVRFVNALDKDITLKPVDSIHHSAVVEANSVKVMTYVRPYFGAPIKSILQIQLKSSYDYVIGISIEQESCVTYIITDFMEIRRVPGVDPIFEGPPGTNDPTMTRVYFANFDTELAMRLVLTYHRSKVVSDGRVDQSEMEIVVLAGKRHVFCIFPGFYFVSTGAGIMSHFVNLEIVVPEAFIVGATEYHVVLGGTINLVCVIEKVSICMTLK